MPHIFIKTQITPNELAEIWQEQSFQLNEIRIKIHKGYSNSDDLCAIFPCLVIEGHEKNWFYIEVCKKDLQRLFIHIDLITPVQRRAGVRLALAWFAKEITGFDQTSRLELRNLADYIHLLNQPRPIQEKQIRYLQKKLINQIHAAQRREQAKKYVISLTAATPPLNWKSVFGNTNPVEIEIGPGKGKFILTEAQQNPQKNYLAIEWAGRYLKILSERLPAAGIENMRLLTADAREIFQNWIEKGSVQAVHVYYPDPWWKTRHKKNKLFSQNFIRDMEKILKKDGFFFFATDVEDVLLELQKLITKSSDLVLTEQKIYQGKEDPPPGRTHFEIKKWETGSTIHQANWKKVNG